MSKIYSERMLRKLLEVDGKRLELVKSLYYKVVNGCFFLLIKYYFFILVGLFFFYVYFWKEN